MNRISYPKSQFPHSAANHVANQLIKSLKKKNSINVALSGGTSPLPVYEALKGFSIDWKRISFFLVDERSVPVTDSQNNFGNINKAIFEHIPCKAYCVHDGTTPPEISAAEYEAVLLKNIPIANGHVQFDLILLGMGLDGHIASLFPKNKALNEVSKAVVHTYVNQLNSTRISLTLPIINNAFRRILLIDSKKEKLFKTNAWKTLPIGLVETENMDRIISELDEN